MRSVLFIILAAGALATVAFDVFGQALSPLLGYSKLAPVGLATSSLKAILGSIPKGSAHLLHTATGLLAYPLGYLLIARPIKRAVLPSLPWLVTATVYGVVLWVFALYVMAHLVAGMKPFLGFGNITWVALWGHIVFAIVAAWVIEAKGLAFDLKNRTLVTR